MREDFGEIWVEHLLPPVSYEPLTREEEMAISTGHFTSFQKRPQQQSGAEGATGRGNTPHHNRTAISTGRGTGGAARHQHPRSFGENSFSSSLERGARFERDYPHSLESATSVIDTAVADSGRAMHGDKEKEKEKGEDEEDILWSMPAADSHLGTFDDKGNFTMSSPPSSYHQQSDLMPPVRGDQSHIPGHDRLPPPTAARSLLSTADSGRSPGAPFAMDPLDEGSSSGLVNESTRWFYRDPSGQMQGPFPTEKMLHWYNRKYFPETLPLRREQDVIFEPLSIWRIKCGGSCPFEAGVMAPHKTGPTAIGGRAAERIPAATSLTSAVGESGMAASPGNNTASILAKLGISWSATAAPTMATPATTAKARMAAPTETPSTRPMMPVPASTTVVTPTASCQSPDNSQKALAQEELHFLQNLRSSNTKRLSTSMEGPMASLSLHQAGQPNDDGKSRPHSHLEPPSGASIDMPIAPRASVLPPPTGPANTNVHTGTTAATTPVLSPLEMKPAIPPSVGWAKIGPTPVAKSLDEIIREEEKEAQAARQQSASSGSGTGASGPRSFAEMFRGSATATAVASTGGSGSNPNLTTTIKSPGGSVAGGKTSIANRSSSAATTSGSGSGSATSTSLPPSAAGAVKAWCLNQLKPLEATYDIQMCTILLMELKTPQEVMGFIEDNLKSNKMDLRAFARGLIERRFGPDMSLPSAERPVETEFVTVERKSRGKKSQ